MAIPTEWFPIREHSPNCNGQNKISYWHSFPVTCQKLTFTFYFKVEITFQNRFPFLVVLILRIFKALVIITCSSLVTKNLSNECIFIPIIYSNKNNFKQYFCHLRFPKKSKTPTWSFFTAITSYQGEVNASE